MNVWNDILHSSLSILHLLLVKACLAGLGLIALYVLANIAIPTALAQFKCAAQRAGRKGIFLLAVPLSFAGVMIGHGSDKAVVGSPSNAGLEDEPSTSLVNAGLGDEPSTSLVEPSTSMVEPSTSLVASLVRHCEVVGASSRPQSSVALNEPFSRIERWFRRGAWEDGFVIPFDEGWVFPHASNHLSQVEIWSQGAVYPFEKSADSIVRVQTPLALKPGETEVFYGRTTNDTYRIEWHNAHPNRDANLLADAAIELRRNGDALAPVSTRFKVFCVGEIVQSTGIAFAAKGLRSVYVEGKGSNAVLAHELGHLFGLEDIYSVKEMDGNTCRIPRSGSNPDITFFSDGARDWPGVDGRGFYSGSDYCEDLIDTLLMCGDDAADNGDLRDIPSGAVEGYGKYALHRADVEDLEVGASKIESEEK